MLTPSPSCKTRLFVCAVLVIVLSGATAVAQTGSNITDGMTPTGLQPGAPSGAYALSGFDNVNLYNGSLSFRLPLLQIGGRGGAGYTMMLPFEQKWIIKQGKPDLSGVTPKVPNPNWWQGIKPGYGPGVLQGRRTGYDSYSGSTYCGTVPNVFDKTLTRLTFTGADGTEYELRDQLTNGAPGIVSSVSCGASGTSRGTVFVATDGSGATFISDATIYDYKYLDLAQSNRLVYPSGYLLLKDGTRYRIESGYVTWIRDRNGNKVTVNGNTITDSLNRTVTITPDNGTTHYDEISYSGYAGYNSGSRSIKVWHASLGSRLRSDYSSTQSYYQLFPLNAATGTAYDPSRVSKVVLPDGSCYEFYYNPYGELARVKLPTGGAFEYDWDGVTDDTDVFIFRYVVERRIINESGTVESKTVYERDTSGTVAPVEVKTYDGAGTHLLGLSKHYFEGDPMLSMIEDPVRPSALNSSPWKEGRELKTETFDIVAGSPVLKTTVEQTYEQPLSGNSWPLGTTETSGSANPNNAQVTQSVTTLADTNLVSKQTYVYDKYCNRTDTYEYNFGTGSAGSLARRSHTDFLTTHPTTSVDYACDPSSTCGNSANLDYVIHLRSLPTQTQVFDGSSNEKARTTFEYDNYTATSPHAALTSYSDISGLCAEVTVASGCVNTSPGSFTKRGNVTATTNYILGSPTTSITSYAQYDIAGNVVRTIDPRGNATTISYSDCFGAPDSNAQTNSAPSALSTVSQHSYAYATSVTNALSQTVYAQYDYNTGLVVNGEDANGVIAAGYFSDALDRPTQIKRAVGSSLENQTTFAYNKTTRTVTTTSDRDTNGDNLLVSKLIYDGLGRTVETRQYESSSDYIAVQTVPFAVVQDGSNWRTAKKVSNPYRPYLSESAIWTTSISDSLGRMVKVITPDSASLGTTYSDNTVTVADQMGRSRKSVTDALGRLVQVYEDPGSSPHLNYLTTYQYDTLDNLTKVIQDNNPASPTQTPREFVYDSLKRLKSATNPESGTINYTYDDNSNLLVRTDARSISTHYSYDNLNRLTRRWYNTSSSVGSTTHTSTTTDEAYFYYDSQSLPSGAPSYTRGAAVGRLVAQTYGGSTSSTGDYLAYDVLGRTTSKYQRTGTVNYLTSATYVLSGAVDTMTYPSTRTVTNSYDAAGRLSSVSGNLGDGTSRTYSTAITYMSSGAFAKEQFGTTTAVYNKAFYNSRGQLSEIRVSSTSGTDTSWNRGAIINHYSNSCWGMCGGANSTTAMTDNNGNLQKQEIYIPNDDANTGYQMKWQQYEYDSLNRLQWAREILDGGSEQWKQIFVYDRYGNRTIDTTNTYGTGINKQDFTVDTSTNRLGVPGGGTGVMQYDDAGNLTNDTYTGAGNRTYDAENKIISAWGGANQAQLYAYDVGGNRIKRTVDGVETWQVYGIGGELVAEYAASGATNSPQKEYGYRNGQLVVTAEPGSRTNVALSSNGSSATASSTYSLSYPASNAINGNRASGEWNDNTVNSFPDYLEVTFPSSKTINEVDVFMLQDNYMSPSAPTESMTFVNYGLTSFDVEYWNGSSWTTIPGGSITGNNHIWRKITFSPITTTKVRVVANASPDGASRVVELEAWEPATGGVHWLVSDQLGTPRIVLDESGILVNVKRHDYLPFGEELFTGTSGRSTSQGYGGGDGVWQQFTSKERDIETGLDYFGARYFASMQGRFTAADPYDINVERQATSHAEDAEDLFRNYIGQPQHWDHYAYALNNPLRFVDPDGLIEYETELLGKKIKVKIADDLKSEEGKRLKGDDLKKAQESIKQNIDNAIAKINAGQTKLSSEQITAINSMKGIEVKTDISAPGMDTSSKVFHLTPRFAGGATLDTLTAAIIHDSHHADQAKHGRRSYGIEAEKEASRFTVPIIKALGLDQQTITNYEYDAEHGHAEWGQKSRPPKKKTP